tara:strand:+ start:432 stop:761 length:330 start_codon:yes stop_codon:yes gene_type:complete
MIKLTHESDYLTIEGGKIKYIAPCGELFGHVYFDYEQREINWFMTDSEFHKSLKPYTPVRPIEEVMADMVLFLTKHKLLLTKDNYKLSEMGVIEYEALLAEAQALGVVE